MEQPTASRASRVSGWFNRLPDWQFTATLYLRRCAINLPVEFDVSRKIALALPVVCYSETS